MENRPFELMKNILIHRVRDLEAWYLCVDGIEHARFIRIDDVSSMSRLYSQITPCHRGFWAKDTYHGPDADIVAYDEAMALRRYRDSLAAKQQK